MPMETENVALGKQRSRNGRKSGRSCSRRADRRQWRTARTARTPTRSPADQPGTKSRHEAFIVCRSNSSHCNSPECPAGHRVFGHSTMSKMHTAKILEIQRTKLRKRAIHRRGATAFECPTWSSSLRC
ncbi:GL20543 [Drosophila persimilis]|uniref:GL20543 n=1 Tax=Drosophila persimilis TaxID=7234 RepID=B4G6X2_DROPE|nr:GL20543 [Drosophila persimilis]